MGKHGTQAQWAELSKYGCRCSKKHAENQQFVPVVVRVASVAGNAAHATGTRSDGASVGIFCKFYRFINFVWINLMFFSKKKRFSSDGLQLLHTAKQCGSNSPVFMAQAAPGPGISSQPSWM